MAMAKCIECEAAVNAVLNLVPKVDDDGYCWVIRGDAARAIGTIPAADVRPVVRGQWKLDSDPGEPWRYVCNICGEKTKDTVMGKPRANFCPNCGADMREES